MDYYLVVLAQGASRMTIVTSIKWPQINFEVQHSGGEETRVIGSVNKSGTSLF